MKSVSNLSPKAGEVQYRLLCGDRRSDLRENHADVILERLEKRSDIILAELQVVLAER